jgi:hypothetical protein
MYTFYNMYNKKRHHSAEQGQQLQAMCVLNLLQELLPQKLLMACPARQLREALWTCIKHNLGQRQGVNQ